MNKRQDGPAADPHTLEVIAPNFKRRLSGVTTTIVQLVPEQRASGLGIAVLGHGLPAHLPRLRYRDLWRLWKRPANRPHRIWHARRNTEMVGGIILRDVLRMPLKLVFTSDAQRHHRNFTKWLISRMDVVIAGSARAGAYLEVPHVVVAHGIDIAAIAQAGAGGIWRDCDLPGQYGIGCFGRIRHQKGTDIFVDAMIELLPRFPDWTAIISGRVTSEHQAFRDGLAEKIEAAGLGERIVFIGEVPDIRLWYHRISLYVAPSRNEGFGLTPLEAMAAGKPVVASDAGAYAEMITPGETGDVAPAGDGERLTAAIRTYLADPALAERHGKEASIKVRARFALEREAEGIRAVYDRVWADL
jgi:mannosyltransferase